MIKKIFTSLQIIFRQSLYRYIAFYTSLITTYLFYWLFTQNSSVELFLEMTKNGDFGPYSVPYAFTYALTTILTIILSGVSVATIVFLYRHSKLGKGKSLGANIGGFLAAAFGMGCPVCGAFLLSLIGVAGGLTIFPLQGLELKFLSLALLSGSTIYGLSKVKANDCEECQDIQKHSITYRRYPANLIVLPLGKVLIFLLIALFALNQFLITQVSVATGISSPGFVGKLFGINTKTSYTIIAPKLNPDGKTTSLSEWPTITEVLANPNSGDALADGKVVMIATGKPFYAPEDISFDDPINAQKKWGAFETSIKLSTEQEARYQKLISTMMTCSYCCGGPNNVTMNKNCGCAHAKAVRGFYRFMIQNYGDKYSDEQFVGESHRWYAIWYPKGMLEDYLLATGKGDTLGHQTHGGAGSDGRHGL